MVGRGALLVARGQRLELLVSIDEPLALMAIAVYLAIERPLSALVPPVGIGVAIPPVGICLHTSTCTDVG